MGENKYMIMDETNRPFEPGEPGYELYLKLRHLFKESDEELISSMGLTEDDLIKPEETK